MALLSVTKYYILSSAVSCVLILGIYVTLELSQTSHNSPSVFSFAIHLQRVGWCEGDTIQGEMHITSCMLKLIGSH